jgi:hypothetical protein
MDSLLASSNSETFDDLGSGGTAALAVCAKKNPIKAPAGLTPPVKQIGFQMRIRLKTSKTPTGCAEMLAIA